MPTDALPSTASRDRAGTAPGRCVSPAGGVRPRAVGSGPLLRPAGARLGRPGGAPYPALGGRQVVDVGGGAGYFAAAFRDRGAQCLLVEPDPAELYRHGAPGRASVIGDGYWLPLADASVDVCFSCNVLEHVRDPAGFIDEMIRVTRPGGLVYLSYTVWLSPWGGHETPRPSTTWAATTRPAGTSAATAGNPRTASGRRCSRSASAGSWPWCAGAPTSPWSRRGPGTIRAGAGS